MFKWKSKFETINKYQNIIKKKVIINQGSLINQEGIINHVLLCGKEIKYNISISNVGNYYFNEDEFTILQ